MLCLEAACHRTRSQRRLGPNRPGDAFKLPDPKVIKLEQIAEQFPRALVDDNPVRFGQRLQARCQVRRLADNASLLRLAGVEQVAHNDQPSSNTNASVSRAKRPPRVVDLSVPSWT